MLDLLTPTDHAGAYEWASVFLAHVALGLALTAVVAAVLDWMDSRTALDLDVGALAPLIVTLVYLVGWEMAVQMLGAGWADALVDTLAVCLGGLAGLFLWRRAGIRLAGVLLIGALAIWRGVRLRK